jgi:hypothetical protein
MRRTSGLNRPPPQLAAKGYPPGMCKSLIVETLFAVFGDGRRARTSTLSICDAGASLELDSGFV